MIRNRNCVFLLLCTSKHESTNHTIQTWLWQVLRLTRWLWYDDSVTDNPIERTDNSGHAHRLHDMEDRTLAFEYCRVRARRSKRLVIWMIEWIGHLLGIRYRWFTGVICIRFSMMCHCHGNYTSLAFPTTSITAFMIGMCLEDFSSRFKLLWLQS